MFEIWQGDCVERMRNLETKSVQLVVTSPPYDDLRTYGSKQVEWDFEATAKELYRVLCDGGVLCWNVADGVVAGGETLTSCKQKIYFVEQCGFRVHDTMIWKKVHVAAPDKTRYHQMFEYVFVLSKGAPRVFNPLIDRTNKYGGKSPFSYNSKRQVDGVIKKTKERGMCEMLGKRSNVWEGNSRAQESPCDALPHPAMMPKWLARDLILSWSNSGDLVLDPFVGSGTVCREAMETGRLTIGIDKNPEYCRLAEQACRTTPGFLL